MSDLINNPTFIKAACTVVLVDRPWTPGDVCQAEVRALKVREHCYTTLLSF